MERGWQGGSSSVLVVADFERLKCRAELQTGGRACPELAVNESSVPNSLWDQRDAPCWDCSAPQFPIQGEAPGMASLLSVPFPETNNGVESTDELSLCSENGFANELVTPTDTKLRIN